MPAICEHEFDKASNKDSKYSELEYDLYAKLQMSIRKNITTNEFEIYSLKDKRVLYHGTLTIMVKKANELEHSENTVVRCGNLCPLLAQERRRRIQ
jgi:hypothetical protein